MEHLISKVYKNSIAEELGVEVGDKLLKIGDNPITDVFDYRYLINDEYIEITILKPNNEEWVLEIEKDFSEDLGMEFESSLMSDYKSCTNKCMFCFIDQMPPGMRDTLYFKDDDSRLSFLQGNYITLTNMKDKDIDRIVKYHLGPINISIHTMNKSLRCKMLNNRFAGESLKYLDVLYENNIPMNGQIVLCKNVNDNEELEYTINALLKYVNVMESVSVVPAGLTRFRKGLYPLKTFLQEDAVKVIDIIENFQKKIYNQTGKHFVHASDEWYITAKKDFPEEERYDGYIQLENGVGMMRLLHSEVKEYLNTMSVSDIKKEISIATGELAYDMLITIKKMINEKYPNIKINVYKIINNFFGDTITVSGLITGQDLIDQLSLKELGETLLLPCNMLRMGEDVFLDDIHLRQIESTLQTNINIVESSGEDLCKAIIGNGGLKKRVDTGFNYIKAYPNE